MKMKFHIPDFWMHWELNLNLIDMIKEHPEYFYDELEIASCFGCFAPALWNGGRAIAGFTSKEQITNTIKWFNERNVPIRFTFTNPTITEKDLKDRFCNRICKEAENGFNEIICNTQVLEDYIRENYPKYPLVSSTCKQLEDYDSLMREFEKGYKLVVLDYNWNNDFERLEKIPMEYRERCEILVNPYCMPHCPRRGEHYKVLGECQRKASTTPVASQKTTEEIMTGAREFKCPNSGFNFYQITGYSTFVGLDSIKRYMEMGFNNFKIEGRVIRKYNVLESYMYYMVKPEYRDMVRLEMLNMRPREPIVSPIQRRFGPQT
ncbi:MAG: hypothetical protein J6A16_11350 [Oscillospiraceae bacterium]|nr:hypothetical protein [Oscillospiraceae bacterium]